MHPGDIEIPTYFKLDFGLPGRYHYAYVCQYLDTENQYEMPNEVIF